MPSATARYGFEHRLARWADGLSRGLTGERCAFFVGFRPDGSVRRVYLMHPDTQLDGETKAKLAGAYKHWFLYSPYGGGREVYIEWLELDRAAVETWLGGPLTDGDLADVRGEGALDAWPSGWRVIVP